MITRKNAKNKTAYVYNKVQDIETFISVPFTGVKNVGTQLTVRDGATRIDLNGRQVASLRKVLDTAYQTAASPVVTLPAKKTAVAASKKAIKA